jgi:hypothetical protein
MSPVRAGGHKFCLLFAPWARTPRAIGDERINYSPPPALRLDATFQRARAPRSHQLAKRQNDLCPSRKSKLQQRLIRHFGGKPPSSSRILIFIQERELEMKMT